MNNMKLIMENWRKHLKEIGPQDVGVGSSQAGQDSDFRKTENEANAFAVEIWKLLDPTNLTGAPEAVKDAKTAWSDWKSNPSPVTAASAILAGIAVLPGPAGKLAKVAKAEKIARKIKIRSRPDFDLVPADRKVNIPVQSTGQRPPFDRKDLSIDGSGDAVADRARLDSRLRPLDSKKGDVGQSPLSQGISKRQGQRTGQELDIDTNLGDMDKKWRQNAPTQSFKSPDTLPPGGLGQPGLDKGIDRTGTIKGSPRNTNTIDTTRRSKTRSGRPKDNDPGKTRVDFPPEIPPRK